MNREKRKRRLQVKVQLEKLETRWLMRAGLGITSALRPLAAPMAETEIRANALSRRLPAELERWLSDHPPAALSADVTQEKLAFQKAVPSGFGEWGALRLLVRLEAQGHHQFDPLYQHIAAKFDVWRSTIRARPPRQVSRPPP